MARPLHSRETAHVVQALAEQVRAIETARRPAGEAVVSSGSPTLDRLLPERGFRRGSLVEWLSGGAGSGAATLALLAAGQAAREGGAVVVVDGRRLFYPPAAVRLGIDLERLIVVHPASDQDHAWAVDQVLRARGVAALWCWPMVEDDHMLRRWQLAAETSGALGMLLRSQAARHEPSWAELRLLVEPLAVTERGTVPFSSQGTGKSGQSPFPESGRNRRLRVELVRSRAGRAGETIELELPPSEQEFLPAQYGALPQYAASPRSTPYETRAMRLASPMALAKIGRRSRGA